MAASRILITGDYWHKDFQNLIAEIDVTATMMTLGSLLPEATDSSTDEGLSKFDLVTIAQSRQGQYDQATIDAIVERVGTTPVVMLLGSWCEGELRSDKPIEGVKRVYWHQWQGRFAEFIDELENEGVSAWHAPATTTDADHIQTITVKSLRAKTEEKSLAIGVSAWNAESYQVLADALKSFGWQPRWIERSNWINMAASLDAICIDAGSQPDKTAQRLQGFQWLKEKAANIPMVLTMNFPRHQDVAELEKIGVTRIVSKPFELADLRVAIEAAVAASSTSAGDSTNEPAPKMTGGKTTRSKSIGPIN